MNFSRLLSVVALIAFAVCAGLLIWGVPRGFDIRDEGFFLMAIRHPEQYPNLTSSYHLIVSRLLGSELGVLSYRWVALLVKLASVWLLAYGFWQWLQAEVGVSQEGTSASESSPGA